MNDQIKLPLKVVPPLHDDYHTPSGGGSDKIFEEPTPEFRAALIDQADNVQSFFSKSFEDYPAIPAVARIKLRHEAIAKSHRPTKIFSKKTCPIIGAEGVGSLLVSVSPAGLSRLIYEIENDNTQKGRANISTLKFIEPFKPNLDVPEDCSEPLKIKLFKHRNDLSDKILEKTFHDSFLGKFKKTIQSEISYGPGIKIFRVTCYNSDLVDKLSHFVGVQSITKFPIYKPVRSQSIPIGTIHSKDFPSPHSDIEYPVVGVVDTGISPDNPLLKPWVIDRVKYVPEGFENYDHGTFVSGLIIHSRRLNHGDERFPSCSSKVIDVTAIPIDGISEDELLSILEDVIPKYPEVKFWNLSIGTNNTISDDHFSDFAVALDRIQHEHGVAFILAAGNCTKRPFRTWPPKEDCAVDRLCSPTDSIRSIVVGSVSHAQNASTASCVEDPSPFSRKGPGPMYVPKPDLSHYGGNCSVDGNYSQSGVMSLDGNSNLAEDVGTSFSAPLICNLAANLSSSIYGNASINLTKALLIHGAAQSSKVISSNLLHFRGFGTPPDLNAMLQCEPWMCTLIFELPIYTGLYFKKLNFPMPPSLFYNASLARANILMTLVYDPELDASFGSEYCRSNVEVSLGTIEPNGKGGFKHIKQVPEDPKLRGSAYEADLIMHGFKWSPVKVYRKNFEKFSNKNPWQLMMKITHRSGPPDLLPPAKQNAALIITVSDPGKSAPVYNEMVAIMNRLGWGASDLQLSHRIRM